MKVYLCILIHTGALTEFSVYKVIKVTKSPIEADKWKREAKVESYWYPDVIEKEVEE